MRIFVGYFSAAEPAAAPVFGDFLFSSVDIGDSLCRATVANPTKDLRARDKNGPACQHYSRTKRGFSWITGREENQECNRCERIASSENYCFRLPWFAANHKEARDSKTEKKNRHEKEIRDDLLEGA